MDNGVELSLLTEIEESPNTPHLSIFTDSSKHITLTSDITAECILNSIRHDKRVIFDGETSQHQELLKKITDQHKDCSFFLCLRNDTFFSLDFIQLIKGYFQQTYTDYADHLTLMERIITTSQEAFSNAFMWSSLELKSTRQIRPQEFYDQIEQRLLDPTYKNRVMSLYLTQLGNHLELGIDVLGKAIDWPEDYESEAFRGTSLISELTDRVLFDANKKGIRLFFRIPPSKKGKNK